MDADEKVKLDYERSAQYFFHLADIRFKLLALLPLTSGTAIAVVPSHLRPLEALAVGILGLVATLGVLLYDQRNTQIYNSLVGRLNLIEASLQLPPMRGNKQLGGAFIDRPGKDGRRVILHMFSANHGLGLDLIYSASMSAWLFVIARSSVTLLNFGSPLRPALSFLPSVLLGILLFVNLRGIDRKSDWEGQPPEDTKKHIDGVASGASNPPGQPTGSAHG